ncbi:MAG: SMC-Scp complex subunit ScpB [Thiotrichales bacterium]|nr:MAG: SMC-Scp complex subunit ScpB [Thiotrichales bacterium]
MEQQQLKNIIEAVLMSAEKPLKVNDIEALFVGDVDMPSRDDIRKVLKELAEDYQSRGFELKQVASGYRIQVAQGYSEWVGRLWEEKPARYSRALLETIALIAYRQPITRGEIEEVRGVSVSSNIIKTLMERQWIKVLGHKDVPGKPALYGTSREFLDYFNLKSLDELPTLAEIRDLDQIHHELDLDLDNPESAEGADEQASDEGESDSDNSDENASLDNGSESADEAQAVVAPDEAESEEAEEDDNVMPIAVAAEAEASDEEQDYVEEEPRVQSVAS